MRVGDWIFVQGDCGQLTIAPWLYEDGSDHYWFAMGDSAPILARMDEATLVTLADAFAYAGHPIPEGAKVWHNGSWRTWAEYQPKWGRELRFGEAGWVSAGISSDSPRTEIDLSRLPVSDAIDALPKIVVEALEAQ